MLTVAALVASLSFASPQSPQDALRTLREEPALEGARIGVFVRDLRDDSIVAESDSQRGFMTASNMKLVSLATALSTLGPDFRFRTTLVATGPIREGELFGDLVLIGSGDPSFGGRDEGEDPAKVFDRMIEAAVQTHGLKRVRGNVLGDDDVQPDEVMGEGWAWNYEGDDYAAQVSGLCFAENCIRLVLQPSAEGSMPRARLSPATGFVEVENRALCTAAGTKGILGVERLRASNHIRITGRMACDAKASRHLLSVENPTAYAATVLRERLVARGIVVDGGAFDRDVAPERPERYGDETVLAVHDSAPLSSICTTLGKVSQNLYAEQVIRAASPGAHSMTAAAAHAKEVLAQIGVDTKGMRIADGSGLSRLDLVRPRQLGDLLSGVWRSPLRDSFRRCLPIGGVDGTLASRFVDPALRGRVVAKTGNISAVTALSGYVLRKDEAAPPLVFAVLLNDFTCPTAAAKEALDRFVAALVSAADR
ncbi:MAG: D-alanyl-D-alanine carboxypeptidase/D-alanyl-D-alanine-endopeptidase [Planctomycetota bacterium]